ncbi:MAG: PAS domain-containing protein [Bacteroidota bacterium]|nr:PAS domain-containing protein [Bacteroidota bacterium]
MRSGIKTKLYYSLGFLFLVILLFGILGIFYINRLSADTDKIIKNNYETLVYSNNMLKDLDQLPQNEKVIADFEVNLSRQEKNITEAGEKEATDEVRKSFEQLKRDPAMPENYKEIRQAIQKINELNQSAISRKNAVAKQTADDASFWLMIIFTILTLIAFTLVFNIPSVIATPIAALSEGIKEISQKNYNKRIYLKREDEFGDLINIFNTMASKLDEYEHSNMAKLQLEKKRIEAIINQMNDAIIGLDANRHILFMNVVAEKLLGLKEAGNIGKYVSDIALHNDLMRTLLQTEDTGELKIYADGKESYFNKEIISVSAGDEIVGEVIVLKNVTPFRELNIAKTNFLATVSHELKTPLSSVKMSLQLLENPKVGNLNKEQQELVDSIKDDADRLLGITGELLKVTQVESGSMQLSVSDTDVSEIFNAAIHINHVAAEKKGIRFELNIIRPLAKVIVDKEKTIWVVSNIIANAIVYSHDQSMIYLAAQQDGSFVHLTIRDTGIGIDAKYQSRIFDRYFRVPGSKKEGTGLGLSICRDLVTIQGGTIDVESELGLGATFNVKLPAKA